VCLRSSSAISRQLTENTHLVFIFLPSAEPELEAGEPESESHHADFEGQQRDHPRQDSTDFASED